MVRLTNARLVIYSKSFIHHSLPIHGTRHTRWVLGAEYSGMDRATEPVLMGLLFSGWGPTLSK